MLLTGIEPMMNCQNLEFMIMDSQNPKFTIMDNQNPELAIFDTAKTLNSQFWTAKILIRNCEFQNRNFDLTLTLHLKTMKITL